MAERLWRDARRGSATGRRRGACGVLAAALIAFGAAAAPAVAQDEEPTLRARAAAAACTPQGWALFCLDFDPENAEMAKLLEKWRANNASELETAYRYIAERGGLTQAELRSEATEFRLNEATVNSQTFLSFVVRDRCNNVAAALRGEKSDYAFLDLKEIVKEIESGEAEDLEERVISLLDGAGRPKSITPERVKELCEQ